MGTFWKEVNIQRFTVGIFQHDLRVQVALVIDDLPSDGSGGVIADRHRLALNNIFQSNATAHFGQNWNCMRVPFAEWGTTFDLLIFFDHQHRAGGHVVFLDLATLGVQNRNLTASRKNNAFTLIVRDEPDSGKSDNTPLFGFGLTLLSFRVGNTTNVEGPHRELCSRFSDTLSCDDSNRHTLFDPRTGRHVHPVAATATTQRCIASHWAAYLDLFETQLLNFSSDFGSDHFALANNHLVRNRVHDVLTTHTTVDGRRETHFDLLAAINDSFGDPLGRSAVFHRDDHVLRDVRKFTSQVTRVGRLECRVGQTFSSTVGRTEILQHVEAFTEVRFDRRFDDFTGRLGHQAPHARQLSDLLDTTSSTRVRHQVNRVDVTRIPAVILAHHVHHLTCDFLSSVSPHIEHLVVSLLFRDHTTLVELLEFQNLFLCLGDDVQFGFGRHQVIGGKGESRSGALAETELVHVIQQVNRGVTSQSLVAVRDDACQFTGFERVVVELHPFGEHHIEQNASVTGLDQLTGGQAFFIIDANRLATGQTDFDLGVKIDDAVRERHVSFFGGGENHVFTFATGQHQRDEVTTHHRIL